MDKICGNCYYYANSPMHGPWCTKKRKEVSYLQSAFDCWTEPGTVPTDEIQMKVCSHCGQILPVSEFRKHKGSPDGLQYACKSCQVEMTTKAKQKRTAKKKALLEEVQKEAMMKKVLAEMPAASSEPEVIPPSDEPQKLNIRLKVEAPILNELTKIQKSLITLQAATDDQLVEELKRRGYTGNIIRKTSFIL